MRPLTGALFSPERGPLAARALRARRALAPAALALGLAGVLFGRLLCVGSLISIPCLLLLVFFVVRDRVAGDARERSARARARRVARPPRVGRPLVLGDAAPAREEGGGRRRG
jgi:hypothetical protein